MPPPGLNFFFLTIDSAIKPLEPTTAARPFLSCSGSHHLPASPPEAFPSAVCSSPSVSSATTTSTEASHRLPASSPDREQPHSSSFLPRPTTNNNEEAAPTEPSASSTPLATAAPSTPGHRFTSHRQLHTRQKPKGQQPYGHTAGILKQRTRGNEKKLSL